jgi:outer membrane protein assembly factor BamB
VKKIFRLFFLFLVSLPLLASDSRIAIDPSAPVRSRFNLSESGGVAVGNGFAVAVTSRGWVEKSGDQGKMQWRVKSSCLPDTGPVFDSEKVYYACLDGSLVALDLANGKQVWKFSFKDSVASPPEILDKFVVIQTGIGKVFALDKNTGALQWLARQPGARGLSMRDAGSPLTVGKTIYLGMSDGIMAALALEDGNLLWKRKIFAQPITSDIDFQLLYDKKYGIFAASREGLASVSETGGKVYFTVDEQIACSPAQDDESIFALNTSNEFLVIDKLMGTVDKRIEIKKPFFAKWEYEKPLGIFTDNQKTYLVFTDGIWQIETHKGTAKKIKTFSNIIQKAAVSQGRLYAIGSKGYLEIMTIK